MSRAVGRGFRSKLSHIEVVLSWEANRSPASCVLDRTVNLTVALPTGRRGATTPGQQDVGWHRSTGANRPLARHPRVTVNRRGRIDLFSAIFHRVAPASCIRPFHTGFIIGACTDRIIGWPMSC